MPRGFRSVARSPRSSFGSMGSTRRRPTHCRRTQLVVTSLYVALRPYTGSSGTLILDDKGLVFTVCFGMPNDAHADDALRAVRAGIAIRTELGRLGLHCAIGVANGVGVCMPLGGAQRRQYWAVGRFMHLAGRLMQAAGKGLLCTEEIANRVRRVVALAPERPLAERAYAECGRLVYETIGIEDSTEQLFGTEDQLARLDQCLGVESGRSRAVDDGEAGVASPR